MATKERLIKILQGSWRREMSGARTYRALAERDPREDRKKILLRLGEAEEHHAERWEARIRELEAQLA